MDGLDVDFIMVLVLCNLNLGVSAAISSVVSKVQAVILMWWLPGPNSDWTGTSMAALVPVASDTPFGCIRSVSSLSVVTFVFLLICHIIRVHID